MPPDRAGDPVGAWGGPRSATYRMANRFRGGERNAQVRDRVNVANAKRVARISAGRGFNKGRGPVSRECASHFIAIGRRAAIREENLTESVSTAEGQKFIGVLQ